MINNILKKNIRLLAEKNGYHVSYFMESITFSKGKDTFNIYTTTLPNMLVIEYDIETGMMKECIPDRVIYHILISLFKRKEKRVIEWKFKEVLNLEDYTREEDYDGRWLKALKEDIINKNIDYKELGGNRFMIEYYMGIVIITDDLSGMLYNVISADEL